jgi:hypothetical protein
VSLTLAFELAALRQLSDPEAAVASAREWSANVGVVTDRPPHVLTNFTRDNYIRNDFEPATEPAAETLEHLLAHFDTDRFVFVAATTDEAPDGWEHQSLRAAASEAGWEMTPAREGGSETSSRERPSGRARDDWP